MVWKLDFFLKKTFQSFCGFVYTFPDHPAVCCVTFIFCHRWSAELALHFSSLLFVCCCLHIVSAVPMQVIKLCHGRCTHVMSFLRANFEVIFSVIGIFWHLSLQPKADDWLQDHKLAPEERNSLEKEQRKTLLWFVHPIITLIPRSHGTHWDDCDLWVVASKALHGVHRQDLAPAEEQIDHASADWRRGENGVSTMQWSVQQCSTHVQVIGVFFFYIDVQNNVKKKKKKKKNKKQMSWLKRTWRKEKLTEY